LGRSYLGASDDVEAVEPASRLQALTILEGGGGVKWGSILTLPESYSDVPRAEW